MGADRPDWLAADAAAGSPPDKPAAKSVPWRTPGSAKPAPPAPPAPAPAAARVPKPRRRYPLWERLLPLVFLLIFVLVVGGYLAGWHLG